jgi:predicted helicase
MLASYARDSYRTINALGNLQELDVLRQSMQQSLNMDFSDEKKEHFFRSTLIQTLFYGIFSAWVFWHNSNPNPIEHFDWRLSSYILKVPVIQSLFHLISDPRKLDILKITQYLELASDALNRVNRAVFFSSFDEGKAIQYFYEPFLQAYDPQLRKDLGVWYTPPEIVTYMVERVDQVLREELGLTKGFAEPNVFVLDPCCGTGGYPLEVLKRISKTMTAKGEDALAAYEIKKAATSRIFGFEILPAPYIIAHLQIGLYLQKQGLPLSNDERAGIFLTNALNGWEPAKGPKQHLLLPELEQERDAAEKIKQTAPILVILGNPPYNAFAGVADTTEEKNMVQTYKEGLREKWGIKKYNLDELYVRFFRLAEKRLLEKEGKGIICYISNSSYLNGNSFVVMREHLLDGFDKLWFDNLNGDSRETGKTTPDGLPDPSVFSTESNREGIRVGTVVGLLVRKDNTAKENQVNFREFWGTNKVKDLLESLSENGSDNSYTKVYPNSGNRFTFRPLKISPEYGEWPSVVELSREYPNNGPIERRGNSLIVFKNEKKELENSLIKYFDPTVSDREISDIEPRFMFSSGEFHAEEARLKLKGNMNYSDKCVVSYPYKPFDYRLAYLSNEIHPLFSRPSPELIEAGKINQNAFLITRSNSPVADEGIPFIYSRSISDYSCLSGGARHFPFLLNNNKEKMSLGQENLFNFERRIKPNLSAKAIRYLTNIGLGQENWQEKISNKIMYYEVLWLHTIAIAYSSEYLHENKDAIRNDWPRIPLPRTKEQLFYSAELGKRISELLELDEKEPKLLESPRYTSLANLRRIDDKQIDPRRGDLAISVGWGIQQNKIVMPGRGKTKTKDNNSLDVFLNQDVFWENVPKATWEYTIGGYQVIKKWLSYREKSVLGRDLFVDEVREFSAISRRISAIVDMHDELKLNYLAVKSNLFRE